MGSTRGLHLGGRDDVPAPAGHRSHLTRIAHRAAPGTRVGLDLVVRPEGYRPPLREQLARLSLAALREPIVGVVPEGELDALFSRAGLALRRLLSCAEVPGGAGAWHGLWLAEVAVPR